jgi:hypothetical protein
VSGDQSAFANRNTSSISGLGISRGT